ncbi:MAG: YfjI family protein [Devosia sp.]
MSKAFKLREDMLEAPLPLFPELTEGTLFPVEALGPIMSGAAKAIAYKVQVPLALAAQSILAAASLAVQTRADVLLPTGQSRPLSLFFVTIAGSGERKSSVDYEALRAVRRYEKELREKHEAEMREYKMKAAAWEGEKKKIERDPKLDLGTRVKRIEALGRPPAPPLYAFIVCGEPTVEGLVRAWRAAPAGLGIFTAEGGTFVGGHAMSDDSRLRSAASLSEIWDGAAIKRIRAIDGVSILYGRRLSIHLMMQEEPARRFLSDPLLRDQGLLSRILISAPASNAGTRLWRDARTEDEQALMAFDTRMLDLLRQNLPLAEGRKNELEPPKLSISQPASAIWREFYNHIEQQCGPDGALAPILGLAAKAAEHAARIAGVLTIFANPNAREINEEAMRGAVELMNWYVEEAARLSRFGHTDSSLLQAATLLKWMQGRNGEIHFREILQKGPNKLRTKTIAEKTLKILLDHRWVYVVSEHPRVFAVRG